MTKYIVTIEFRYLDSPKYNGACTHRSKTITVGIYDDFDNACINGNKALEDLEKRFKLHVFPNGIKAPKERFSKNGGPFGTKKTLITDIAYLKTPFNFFAKIDALDFNSLNDTIDEVVKAVKTYKEYKRTLNI